MKRFRNPGIYLAIMGWWIMPFFGSSLARYPVTAYFSSYVPFLLVFFSIAVSGIILWRMNIKNGFWNRSGHWRRFSILWGTYALSISVALAITLILDSYNMIAYFGGCAAGSFGMLYIPSIVLYFIFGILLSTMLTVAKRRNRGNQGTPCT